MPRHQPTAAEIDSLIRAYQKNWAKVQIGQSFGLSRSLVYKIIQEYLETGRVERKERGGA